ncbi:MAG TPA: hypothetical protein VJ801_19345, partial [Polyangia bacterium]|nr:hypothetical protein [Polyangia bacterium]
MATASSPVPPSSMPAAQVETGAAGLRLRQRYWQADPASPATQARPVWQGVTPVPVQQGWAAAPQAWHRLVMQRLPVEQVAPPPPPPAQQAWPVAPQGPQVPVVNEAAVRPEQVSVAALHEPVLPVPQHACPSAPQAPHWLPVAVSMQPIPPVWHWLVPPSPPPPPAQQAWPVPPQGPQVPVANVAVARPDQASVAALHVPV